MKKYLKAPAQLVLLNTAVRATLAWGTQRVVEQQDKEVSNIFTDANIILLESILCSLHKCTQWQKGKD